MSDYMYGQKQKEHTKFLEEELLPTLKFYDYKGPAPPKSLAKYESWTTDIFEPYKKGKEETARLDYIAGIEEHYKTTGQYDISPVTGKPKTEFDWKLPEIKDIEMGPSTTERLFKPPKIFNKYIRIIYSNNHHTQKAKALMRRLWLKGDC